MFNHTKMMQTRQSEVLLRSVFDVPAAPSLTFTSVSLSRPSTADLSFATFCRGLMSLRSPELTATASITPEIIGGETEKKPQNETSGMGEGFGKV